MKRRIFRSSTCLLLPCAIEAALLGGCADFNGVDATGAACAGTRWSPVLSLELAGRGCKR
jgi:hypothetical protein